MKQREVDLSKLPKTPNGFICWTKCKGYEVPFVYDGIEGKIYIVNVYKNKNKKTVFDVMYNDKMTYDVPSSSIKEGIIGRIIGTKSFDFRTEIGQCFVDGKRNYIIVDQRRGSLKSEPTHTQRQVKVHCLKCGEETWMAEERVLPPKNCACKKCMYSPKAGKESIVETDAWMIPYFQGGYEEAKLYTRGQGEKKIFVCPYCKKKRNFPIAIATLARTHSIGCDCQWSKMPSFPERLFKALLDELGVNYIKQCSNKELSWITTYRYDFFLPDYNVIVEVHGKEHYEEGTGYYTMPLDAVQKNDRDKKELACHEGGILEKNYIVIDCRKSLTNYIKENVLNSRLRDILSTQLDRVDWISLTERAWKSEKIEISKYIKENPDVSVRSIAEKFEVSRDMIKEIQVGLNIYDSGKEKQLGVKRQKQLFLERTEERDREICKIKDDNPNLSSTEIAELIGMERHSVTAILRRRGKYDKELEKENRYNNISRTRRKNREKEYAEICKYKIDFPSISAREVGKRTGHAHGYIIKIWRENGIL